MGARVGWLCGLMTTVSASLLAQADFIPDGFWRHAIMCLLIVSVAATGYMTQHPWDGQDRRDHSKD